MIGGLVARVTGRTGREAGPGATGAGCARGVRPGRDVLSVEREGTAVLLDLRREIYFGLDEVGTAIWQRLEAGAGRDEIVSALAAEYEAPAASLEQDVDGFVAELVSRGLVVRT